MKVLAVCFGGVDFDFLERFDCSNLKQRQYGRITVDELWRQRDVSTQIMSQFVTGKTWRESGVLGRKRYVNDNTELVEKRLIKTHLKGHPKFGRFEKVMRMPRMGLYRYLDAFDLTTRNYLRDDLTCDTMFDRVPNSKAVYVPSYNPEPSWALGRNILDPRKFPSLGEAAAVDLAEKNFDWRRKKFLEEADEEYQLLVAQFQILDSYQHLYLSYNNEPPSAVEDIYRRMDAFAGEIRETFDQYDRVLFFSENGAARSESPPPTHHNRPFYSLSDEIELDGTNMRDFHRHVLAWVQEEPNAVKLLA